MMMNADRQGRARLADSRAVASPQPRGTPLLTRPQIIQRFVPGSFKCVPRSTPYNRLVADLGRGRTCVSVQGYLAHKKQPPPRTLQEDYI